jgi:hypothetical protein
MILGASQKGDGLSLHNSYSGNVKNTQSK